MLVFIDSVLKEDKMLINDTEAVERRSVKSGERDKRGFRLHKANSSGVAELASRHAEMTGRMASYIAGDLVGRT